MVKIAKSRSGKVAGGVAAVMALGEWMTFEADLDEPLPDDLIRLI